MKDLETRQGRDHVAESRVRGRSRFAADRRQGDAPELYDGTVEGLPPRTKPIFSVQYHPEASPGPHDADYLFQQFVDDMERRRV